MEKPARPMYLEETLSSGRAVQEDRQGPPGGQAAREDRQCPGGQAAKLRQDNLRLEGDFSRRERREWLPAQVRAIVMN